MMRMNDIKIFLYNTNNELILDNYSNTLIKSSSKFDNNLFLIHNKKIEGLYFKQIINITRTLEAKNITIITSQFKNSKLNGKSIEYISHRKYGPWVVFEKLSDIYLINDFDILFYKISQKNYINDVLDGDIINYHENQKVKEIIPIKNYKKNGEYRKYNIFGVLIQKTVYINDVIKNKSNFDNN
jgi:antitoxin component YwqK of YwqJK toxin-antitoxin module